MHRLVQLLTLMVRLVATVPPATMAQPPQTIAAPDCGQCLCTLELGNRDSAFAINEITGDITLYDSTSPYKEIEIYSKNSQSRGILIQQQNNMKFGTGSNRDSKVQLKAPQLVGSISAIDFRYSIATSPNMGCHIQVTMSDGFVFQDNSDSYGDFGCDQYTDRIATFTSTQIVYSFYSYTHPQHYPTYLGVYYNQCACLNVVITIPTVLSMQASVLGGGVTQTLVLDMGGNNDCSPINVSITPAATWLTYTYVNRSLVITIVSQNVAEIESVTFTITADFNSDVTTQKTTTFLASITPCQVTSYTQVSPLPDQTYKIATQGPVVITPTYTWMPLCPSVTTTFGYTTDFATTSISVFNSQSLQINTSDFSLSGTIVQVTITSTPTSFPAFAVVDTFQVNFIRDCLTLIVSAISNFTTINAIMGSGVVTQTITLTDDNSQLCGSYTLNQLAPLYPWLSFTLLGTQLTASVDANAAIGGTYSIQLNVKLLNHANTPTPLPLSITVNCATTSLIPSQSINSSYEIYLFRTFSMTLPQFIQLPLVNCNYPVVFSSTSNYITQNGQLSLRETDSSLVGSYISLYYKGQTVSTTPVLSPVQRIDLFVKNGCNFTEISKVSGPKVVIQFKIGQKNATVTQLQFINTISELVRLPSYCGEYTVVFEENLQKPSFITSTQNLLMVHLLVQTDDLKFVGTHQIVASISLASYQSVLAITTEIKVEIFAAEVYLPVILPNLKQEGLSLNQTIYTGSSSWSYTLPPTVYQSPNLTDSTVYTVLVTVNVPSKANFIIWNNQDQSFYISGPVKNEMIGNYTILIVLQVFDFNSTQRTQIYEFNLRVINSLSSQAVVIGTAQKFEASFDKIKATLQEIKTSGLVMLNFTENLVISSNFWETYNKQQNSTEPILTVKVDPGPESDPSKLLFDWNLVSVENLSMQIQLEFKSPAYVSSNYDNPDSLQVIFNNLEFFRSKSATLNYDSKQLNATLPKQQTKIMAAATEAVKDTILTLSAATLCTNFVLNVLLGGLLSELWAMINSLQLIVHTQLFRISFPANAEQLITIFMSVASFNVVPTDSIMDDYVNKVPGEALTQNFEQLGYSSPSVLKNLGLIAILFVGFWLLQVLYFMVYHLSRCCSIHSTGTKKILKFLQNNSVGDKYITFILESYLQCAVSTLIYLLCVDITQFQVILSTIFACLVLAILIGYPLLHLGFLVKNFKKLQEEQFQDENGTYYQNPNYRITTKWGLSYNFVYAARRMLLAVICVLIPTSSIQLIAFLYVQHAIVIYLNLAKPCESFQKNRLDFRDECVINLMLLHMFCMTDFVGDASTRNGVGYSFCGVFSTFVMVKVTLLFVSAVKRLKRWIMQCIIQKKLQQIQKNKILRQSQVAVLDFDPQILQRVLDYKKSKRQPIVKEPKIQNSSSESSSEFESGSDPEEQKHTVVKKDSFFSNSDWGGQLLIVGAQSKNAKAKNLTVQKQDSFFSNDGWGSQLNAIAEEHKRGEKRKVIVQKHFSFGDMEFESSKDFDAEKAYNQEEQHQNKMQQRQRSYSEIKESESESVSRNPSQNPELETRERKENSGFLKSVSPPSGTKYEQDNEIQLAQLHVRGLRREAVRQSRNQIFDTSAQQTRSRPERASISTSLVSAARSIISNQPNRQRRIERKRSKSLDAIDSQIRQREHYY